MVSAPPFRLEEQMVEPLLDAIPNVFPLSRGYRRCVLREPAIGSVIPDILMGTWTGDLPRFAGLNSVGRHILASLACEPDAKDCSYVYEELFVSRTAANAAISHLVKLGAIRKHASGEIQVRSPFTANGDIHIASIEIKLRRWREALNQAIQYKQFSDQSWVVLDASQVSINEEMVSSFKDAGIGLLLQCGWGVRIEIDARNVHALPCTDRVFSIAKLSLAKPYCFA
jgi:hypothetical protein